MIITELHGVLYKNKRQLSYEVDNCLLAGYETYKEAMAF